MADDLSSINATALSAVNHLGVIHGVLKNADLLSLDDATVAESIIERARELAGVQAAWPVMASELRNALDAVQSPHGPAEAGGAQAGNYHELAYFLTDHAILYFRANSFSIDPVKRHVADYRANDGNNPLGWSVPAIDYAQLAIAIRHEFQNAQPSSQSPSSVVEVHEDGPDINQPEAFYWAGRIGLLGKRNWQLCCAIWQVGLDVWGQDNTSTDTIKSQLSRLNSKMADLKIPLAWVNRSERIYLDDGGSGSVAE